jgi:hypothetical protein
MFNLTLTLNIDETADVFYAIASHLRRCREEAQEWPPLADYWTQRADEMQALYDRLCLQREDDERWQRGE